MLYSCVVSYGICFWGALIGLLFGQYCQTRDSGLLSRQVILMDRHAEGPLDALWSAVAAGAGPTALTTPISSGQPCTCLCTPLLHPPLHAPLERPPLHGPLAYPPACPPCTSLLGPLAIWCPSGACCLMLVPYEYFSKSRLRCMLLYAPAYIYWVQYTNRRLPNHAQMQTNVFVVSGLES